MIHLAKQVATLDRISGGRVVLGVGVGWNKEEARNHGIPPRHRGAILDEKLAALKAIWTQDEPEFHGRFVDFDPIYCWPKPLQRPHPPILVGGESPAAVARLIRYGDGWLPRARTSAEDIGRTRQTLSENDRTATITVCGVEPTPSAIDRLARLEVDEVTFSFIPSTDPAPSLTAFLDGVARVVAAFR